MTSCHTKLPAILAIVAAIIHSTGPDAVAQAEQPVTFASLLDEMVDRESLVRWPDPAYTCKQASSYDRDSNDPDNAGTWYANWDRSQFVRTENHSDGRKEYVLMDEVGPGAVVRFWGTWHGPSGEPFSNGALRVYLDGDDTPVIEGPIRDVLSGGALVGAPLSDYVSKTCPEGNRAHNLYLPIPYAKRCKITYETDAPVDRGARKGEALYYQINYRTYATDTAVQSFSRADLLNESEKLNRVQALLSKPPSESLQDVKTVAKLGGPLEAGEARHVALQGPAAIRELRFRLKADDPVQALRSTVLEISFDGEQTVWCPIGDFFGASYHAQAFETWYTAHDGAGGLTARWVMPFAESAVIRIRNLGEETVQIDHAEIDTKRRQWDEYSMHFHAAWREYTQYETKNADMSGRGGPRDANYVQIKGQGVFVGDTLTLFDGAPDWWGEGDEKIYVDGETFPSHFGTGTEDYYGYAWCRGEYFCMPFHAQPIGTGNLGVGPSVNSRFRTLDAIPFKKSLRFDMEIWSWANTKINYAPTTFWYARLGSERNIKPMPEAAAAPIAQ